MDEFGDQPLLKYRTKLVNQKNVHFVSKAENPPNVPVARPIEKYWSLCKGECLKRPAPPKNLLGFKKIWKNISVHVAQRHGKSLMTGFRRHLRAIAEKGVLAPYK